MSDWHYGQLRPQKNEAKSFEKRTLDKGGKSAVSALEPEKIRLPNLRIRLAIALIAVFGLLTAPSQAAAQAPSPYAVETNIHGVYAYTQPPPGFDPSTASAADLEL